MFNRVIKNSSIGEILEKKSRFICELQYVDTQDEALDFIKNKKKQFHDARHNCYAYIIGNTNPIVKCSDDGEPSGTAGRPMLDVLEGENIYNVVCVVTRYFGGVLLGTGGLIRAYQGALKEALKNAEICEMKSVFEAQIVSDYTNWAKLDSMFREYNVMVSNVEYGENVQAIIYIPENEKDKVVLNVKDLSFGKAEIDIIEGKLIASDS